MIIISLHSQPSQYVFKHITPKDGLLNAQVGCLFQDKTGYMWIGTNNGLQRYDGYRFVNYQPDISDKKALHSSVVAAVFEDSRGRLWVSAGSMYILNRATGKFDKQNLHITGIDQPLIRIEQITEDKTGNIWMKNTYGYFRLNKNTNQLEDMSDLAGMKKGITASFLETDEDGNIWMITSASITCYNPVTDIVFNSKNNPNASDVFNTPGMITSFTISGKNIWLSYTKTRNIYRYNRLNGDSSVYSIPVTNENKQHSKNADFDIKLSSFTPLQNGAVAFSIAGEGICIYDPSTNNFNEALINNEEVTGLHSNAESFAINTMYTDRDGNIWANGSAGLNIFNPLKNKFSYYGTVEAESKEDHPAAYPAAGFFQLPDNGDIFVTYYYPTAGMIRFTSNLKVKKKYLLTKNGTTNLRENQLWGLFADNEGNLWAPNQAKTFLKLDIKTDRLTEVKNTAFPDNINAAERDREGNIWMGTWKSGLQKIDAATNLISNYTSHLNQNFPSPFRILSLYNDNDSILWAGTYLSGLLKYNKLTNLFTAQYVAGENVPNTISSNAVLKIIPCGNDSLILATALGINLFDKRTKQFSNISGKDGLPGNLIQSIILDENRNLWVACDGGFCKINLPTKRITRYGTEDGISDYLFNNASMLKLNDGRYMAPGSKGFIVFRPSDIITEKPPLVPVITGFKVFDKYISSDSLLSSGKTVNLSYNDNSVIFEFSSLQFNSPGQLKYYYMLQGIDKKWVTADEVQSAQYNQLAPGNYVFKVKSVNRDGIPSQGFSSIRIYVRPPFWGTWWFRAVVALLAASAIFALLRWKRKRRKEKEQLRIEYEKRIAAVEMSALRAQMNPHFIFNSLNSINTFILENDQENAEAYLQKFSSLVRLILDNSRSDWILLENELKALRLYIELESLRFENVFSHHIQISPDVHAGFVWMPPLIIQPYVENAIRHGLIHRDDAKGKLDINVWKENGQLLIEIKDNGIGREASAKMKNRINKLHQPSHGMQITAERLDIINAVYNVNAGIKVTDIMGENGECAGTKVLLTIQYKANAGSNN